MIRVLYVTRAKLSLSRAHNRNILKTADALAAITEYDVVIVAPKRINKDAELIKKIYNISYVKIECTISLLSYILRNRRRFDIFYFRDVRLIFHAFVARVLGMKIIFEIHGNREWRLLLPLWCLAYKVSHGSIFITKKLFAWYGSLRPSIVLFPNASDVEAYEAVYDKRAIVRSELGITHREILLIYSGGMLWYNLRWIIDLLTYLPVHIKLLLVGSPEKESRELNEYVKKKGLASRVIVKTRILTRDVPRLLIAGDILLNPPTLMYEGSISSKLFEYLSVGVPIITSPAGANDEVIENGVNGIIIESQQHEAFVDRILFLINHPDRAKQLGNHAKQDAYRYTWRLRARQIAKFLELIINI